MYAQVASFQEAIGDELLKAIFTGYIPGTSEKYT
jgi:hypothetical protein